MNVVGRFFILSVLWCAVFGCGKSSPHPVAPVRGTVTLNGKPLQTGSVVFRPFAEGENRIVGKAAYGEIDANGNYVLGTYGRRDGAVVGNHHVMVNYELWSTDGKSQMVKIGFNEQRFEVQADRKNVYDLNLTTDMVEAAVGTLSRTPPHTQDR